MKHKKKKIKLSTISNLQERADGVFSFYIRLRDSKNRLVICYTCGVRHPLKKMHAGHYISRIYLATRYDETNVHGQCPGCNKWKHGNLTEYAAHLINDYGEDILLILHRKAQILVVDIRSFLEEKIVTYKKKILVEFGIDFNKRQEN